MDADTTSKQPIGPHGDAGSMAPGVLLGAFGALVLVGVAVLAYEVGRGNDPAPSPAAALASPTSTSTPTSTPTTAQATEGPPSTGPQGWSELYEQVYDGVVRLEVVGCDTAGTGSGALIAPDLVLTAAHVVQDTTRVQLIAAGQTASGDVLALSEVDDLALVRASRTFPGHVFDLQRQTPRIGTQVVALGYPLSGPLSLAGPGIISAHDETVEYGDDGPTVEGLMRTSLPINPGDSGGPVLDESGSVVGLVSGGYGAETGVDGIKYAVPAGLVSQRVGEWESAPDSVDPTACSGDEAEQEGAELVTTVVDDAEADAVRSVLFDYADGINRSDYERAFAQLSPAQQERIGYDRFVDDQATSVLSDVVVVALTPEDDRLSATAFFTSMQAPEDGPDGLSCAYWTLDWLLVPGGEHGWQIDGSREVPGEPRFQPCAG